MFTIINILCVKYICYNSWINTDKLSLKFIVALDFLSFYLLLFICDRIASQMSHTCNCPVSLGPSWLWQFCRLFCVWWSWQFWRVLVRYFVGCPSFNISLVFFSWLDWKLKSPLIFSFLGIYLLKKWLVSCRIFHILKNDPKN